MVDARVLREMADRVERLPGPDHETDQLVSHVAVQCGIEARVRWATRSIDDAAALMPGRWRLAGLQQHETDVGGWHATGLRPPPGAALVAGDASTEPLARTACALRAIASDIEAKEAERHG